MAKHPPAVERLLDPVIAARYRLRHHTFDQAEHAELAATALAALDDLLDALGEPQVRPEPLALDLRTRLVERGS